MSPSRPKINPLERPSRVQEAQHESHEAPRAPQETPGGRQEAPGSFQEAPRKTPGGFLEIVVIRKDSTRHRNG